MQKVHRPAETSAPGTTYRFNTEDVEQALLAYLKTSIAHSPPPSGSVKVIFRQPDRYDESVAVFIITHDATGGAS